MWLISFDSEKVHKNLLCFTFGGAENLAEFLGINVLKLFFVCTNLVFDIIGSM